MVVFVDQRVGEALVRARASVRDQLLSALQVIGLATCQRIQSLELLEISRLFVRR